jgi:hypothetical protein
MCLYCNISPNGHHGTDIASTSVEKGLAHGFFGNMHYCNSTVAVLIADEGRSLLHIDSLGSAIRYLSMGHHTNGYCAELVSSGASA